MDAGYRSVGLGHPSASAPKLIPTADGDVLFQTVEAGWAFRISHHGLWREIKSGEVRVVVINDAFYVPLSEMLNSWAGRRLRQSYFAERVNPNRWHPPLRTYAYQRWREVETKRVWSI